MNPADAVPQDLSALLEHLQAVYPDEGCGLIWRGPGGFRTQPIENAYDRLRAGDPLNYPRSAASAFEFDPAQWLEASLDAERRGETLACVFHSHCDTDACFSAEDRACAAPDGAPLLPSIVYLVVAIDRGRIGRIRIYWWERGEFQEIEFPRSLTTT